MSFYIYNYSRRKQIINRLLQLNAVSKEKAVTFREAGIPEPRSVRDVMIIKGMFFQGVLYCDGDKYYLDTTKL